MHTVEKIGGTSMSCFKDLLENIFLSQHPKHGLYQRIFVVSAYSGMTNQLLEHKKTGKHLFLFVREHSKDAYGSTMGSVNFGEVEYVSHHGSQPMNITWQLNMPIPAFMWKQAAKLAVG